MGHAGRMSDQAFHAAQKNFASVNTERVSTNLRTPLTPPANLETQHGAEAGLLLLGYFISWMRPQAWIMNLHHSLMLPQYRCDNASRLLLALNAGKRDRTPRNVR